MKIAGIFSKQLLGFPSETTILNKKNTRTRKKIFCLKMFGQFENITQLLVHS